MSLARDALASGDPVLAENYLQHAEHYNRIIMAFREHTMQQSGEAMNGVGRHRSDGQDTDEFTDEDGDEAESYAVPSRRQEPQPRLDGPTRFDDRQNRQEHGRPARDRGREQRNGSSDRSGQAAQPQPQPAEQPTIEASSEAVQPEPTPRRRDRFGSSAQEQPEFLRRSVRRPRRGANGGSASEANGAAPKDDAGEQ